MSATLQRERFEAQSGLAALRLRTAGSPSVVVGVVDGPVAEPVLSRWASSTVALLGRARAGSCAREFDHGAVTALLLGAGAEAPLPGLCAGCRVLIRPTLTCVGERSSAFLHASVDALAEGIADCLDAGARIINLSVGVRDAFGIGGQACGPLGQVLVRAQRLGAVLVWAAGNHPAARGPRAGAAMTAVLPVAACDKWGALAPFSNFGPSLGMLGLLAPGVDIPTLGADGRVALRSGTSLAAPFVTAALALLSSLAPRRPLRELADLLRSAAARSCPRRRCAVPPCLNAGAALNTLIAES